MGRMDFIADERVVPPVTTKQPYGSVHSRDGFDSNALLG